MENSKRRRRLRKLRALESESTPPLPPIKEDPAKPLQAKPVAPTKLEPPSKLCFHSAIEGGGSEAGAGNLLGKGDIGIVPETGSAGVGGGTAASGLGRSSGAPRPTGAVDLQNQPRSQTNSNRPRCLSANGAARRARKRCGAELKWTLQETSPRRKLPRAAAADSTRKRSKPSSSRASNRRNATATASPRSLPTSIVFAYGNEAQLVTLHDEKT